MKNPNSKSTKKENRMKKQTDVATQNLDPGATQNPGTHEEQAPETESPEAEAESTETESTETESPEAPDESLAGKALTLSTQDVAALPEADYLALLAAVIAQAGRAVAALEWLTSGRQVELGTAPE